MHCSHCSVTIYKYAVVQVCSVFSSTLSVLIVWRLEFKFTGANRGEITGASDWLPALSEGIRKVYAWMKAGFFFSLIKSEFPIPKKKKRTANYSVEYYVHSRGP